VNIVQGNSSGLSAPSSAERGSQMTVSADVTAEQVTTNDRNTVEMDVTYVLEDPDTSGVELNQTVELEPGETKTVSFTVDVPNSTTAGDVDATHRIETNHSSQSADITLENPIQTAVDYAGTLPAPQTVDVRPGTYVGDVFVDVADLTIQSLDTAENTTVDATGLYGIAVSADNVTIDGFTFDQSVSGTDGVSVNSATTNTVVHGNTFLTDIGVSVRSEVTITENTFDGTTNATEFFGTQDLNDSAAHYNNFLGNNGEGVVVGSSTTGTLNATLNWWGNETGPSGEGPGTGDSVDVRVDFDPWLDAPYPNGDAVSDRNWDFVQMDGDEKAQRGEMITLNATVQNNLEPVGTQNSDPGRTVETQYILEEGDGTKTVLATKNITVLPGGETRVSLTAQLPSGMADENAEHQIRIEDEFRGKDLNISQGYGTIQGTVTASGETATTSSTPGTGEGIENATLTLTPDNPALDTVVITDVDPADGAYENDSVAFGDYTIEVDAPGFENETRQTTVPVDDTVIENFELDYAEAGSISGEIELDEVDPAEDVNVTVTADDGENSFSTEITIEGSNTTGTYTIDPVDVNVDDGYNLTAEADNYETAVLEGGDVSDTDVLLYELEDGSGTNVTNEAGPDGTIESGDFDWISPGSPETGNNFALEIRDNIGVNPNDQLVFNDTFTVDMQWRHVPGTGTDLAYMFNDQDSTSNGFRMFTGGSAGTGIYVRATAVGGSTIKADNLDLHDGEWHNIRLVMDAEEGTTTLYVDGQQEGQANYDGNGFTSDPSTFRVMGTASQTQSTAVQYDEYSWTDEAVAPDDEGRVLVDIGEDVQDVNLTMNRETASISGNVTASGVTADSTVPGTGDPIENATVKLYEFQDDDSGTAVATTTTDANGEYEFQNVLVATDSTHYVQVADDENGDFATPVGKNTSLTTAGATVDFALDYSDTGAITGEITLDEVDPDEDVTVTITVLDDGSQVASVDTTITGSNNSKNYTITPLDVNVDGDGYTVTADADHYLDDDTTAKVEPGETTQNVDLALERETGSISGTATADPDGFEPDSSEPIAPGDPIANLTLELYAFQDDDSGSPVATVETDENGEYELTDVPVTNASASDHYLVPNETSRFEQHPGKNVSVDANATTTVDFLMDAKEVSITANATLDTGAPSNDFTVTYTLSGPENLDRTRTTNVSQGETDVPLVNFLDLTTLEPGETYNLTVEAEGYNSVFNKTYVAPGGSANLTGELTAKPVTVRADPITLEPGSPEENLEFEAQLIGPGGSIVDTNTFTVQKGEERLGSTTFVNLPPLEIADGEEYTLKAMLEKPDDSPQYTIYNVSAYVAPGQTRTDAVHLKGPVQINGSYYATIQQAVNAASPDDIIQITEGTGNGTYVEDVTIPAGKDNLTLAGTGQSNITIDGDVTVNANETTIQNLTIEGDYTDNGNNNTLDSVTVTSSSPGGVATLNGNDAVIENSSLEQLNVNGADARVTDSTVDATAGSSDLFHAVEVDGDGLLINDSTLMNDLDGSGERVLGGSGGAGKTVTLSNNDLTGTAGTAGSIVDLGAWTLVADGNTFTAGAGATGIRINVATDSTVTNNEFDDLSWGVNNQQSDNVTITNNEFTNVTTGAVLVQPTNGPLTDVTIERNNVTDSAAGFVFISDPAGSGSIKGDLNVSFNNFENLSGSTGDATDDHGVFVGEDFNTPGSSSVTTVNATYSWWDDRTGPGPVGPGLGVNVTTGVDFNPWLDGPFSSGVPVSDENFEVNNFSGPSTAERGDTVTASADVTNDLQQVGPSPNDYGRDVEVEYVLFNETGGAEVIASKTVQIVPDTTETVTLTGTIQPSTTALDNESLTQGIRIADEPNVNDTSSIDLSQTIQQAVDTAGAGGTADAFPGTYEENVNIPYNGLTLTAADANNLPTLDAGGSGNGLEIHADSVTVSDFKFTNGGNEGVRVDGANDVTLERINVTQFTNGLRVGDSDLSGLSVNASTFEDNGNGVSVNTGGAAGVTVTYSDIENNSLAGVQVAGSTDPTNVKVVKNNIAGNNGGGDWGIQNQNAGAGDVNGTLNWWGDATGPGGEPVGADGTGDNITQGVTFEPWLDDRVENNPNKTQHTSEDVRVEFNDGNTDDTSVRETTVTAEVEVFNEVEEVGTLTDGREVTVDYVVDGVTIDTETVNVIANDSETVPLSGTVPNSTLAAPDEDNMREAIGQTVEISDANGPLGSNTTVLNVSNPIQQAVDTAADLSGTDTATALPGNYSENVDISGSDYTGLTLTASDQNNLPVLEPADDTVNTLTIWADGVTLSYFNITGGDISESAAAVSVRGSADNVTISESELTEHQFGVSHSGDQVTVNASTISNNDRGFQVNGGSGNATVTYSDIENNNNVGVVVLASADANTVKVVKNNIAGNDGGGNYGVENDASGTVNATLNWWGDATGPGGDPVGADGTGDNITDGVAFEPWLDDRVENNPNKTQHTSEDVRVEFNDGNTDDTSVRETTVTAEVEVFNEVEEVGTLTDGREVTVDYVVDGVTIDTETVNVIANDSETVPLSGTVPNSTLAAPDEDNMREAIGQTVEISDANGPLGSNTTVLNVSNPIQQAVDTAADLSSEDTATALPGTYTENVVMGPSASGDDYTGLTLTADDANNPPTLNAGNSGDALEINADSVTVSDFTFTNGGGSGVELSSGDSVTIERIDSTQSETGLRVTSPVSGLTINASTFTNNNLGIDISGGGAPEVTVTYSDVESNSLSGVRVFGADGSNVEVTRNNIVGNNGGGDYGVENNNPNAGDINATLNWWGDASGPGGPQVGADGTGDNITQGVTFEPWLDDRVENNPNRTQHTSQDLRVEFRSGTDDSAQRESTATAEVEVFNEVEEVGTLTEGRQVTIEYLIESEVVNTTTVEVIAGDSETVTLTGTVPNSTLAAPTNNLEGITQEVRISDANAQQDTNSTALNVSNSIQQAVNTAANTSAHTAQALPGTYTENVMVGGTAPGDDYSGLNVTASDENNRPVLGPATGEAAINISASNVTLSEFDLNESSNSGTGIEVSGGDDVLVEDVTSKDFAAGLAVKPAPGSAVTSLEVNSSAFTSNDVGIQFDNSSMSTAMIEADVTYSDIENNAAGVQVASGTDVDKIAINWNNIVGNAEGIENNEGPDPWLDAQFNWWGDADGPSGEVGLPGEGGSGDTVSQRNATEFGRWLDAPSPDGEPVAGGRDDEVVASGDATASNAVSPGTGIEDVTVEVYTYTDEADGEPFMTIQSDGSGSIDFDASELPVTNDTSPANAADNHLFKLSKPGYATLTVNISVDQGTESSGSPIRMDYDSIQTAIDQASQGDTIEIANGTYNENITLNRDNLELRGSSINDTVIMGNVTVTGDDNTIRDLKIIGNYSDQGNSNKLVNVNVTSASPGGTVHLQGSNGELTGITVEEVIIEGESYTIEKSAISNESTGPLLTVGSDVPGATLTSNEFIGGPDTAIYLRDDSGNLSISSVNSSNSFDSPVSVEGSSIVSDPLPAGTVLNVDTGDVFDNIQPAVDNANANNRIVAGPSAYQESVNISVTGLTLEGPNAGIDGNDTAARDTEATITQGVEVNASGVTLDGLDVTNSDDVDGIRLSEAPSQVTVTNTVVRDIDGATVGTSKSAGNGINLQFTDVFRQTSTGIEITNNLITRVTTPDASGSDPDANASGVQLLPRGNDVVDLRIANNTIEDIEPGVALGGRSEARGVSIATQFTDTPGGTRGDFGQATGLTVADNDISNFTADFARAVTLFEDQDGDTTTNDALGPVDFTVTGNTVTEMDSTDGSLPDLAMFVGEYGDFGAAHSVQQNNFLAGVENLGSSSDSLTATENWWGSDSGPAGDGPGTGPGFVMGDGDIQFTPWLDAPAPDGQPVSNPQSLDGDGTLDASDVDNGQDSTTQSLGASGDLMVDFNSTRLDSANVTLDLSNLTAEGASLESAGVGNVVLANGNATVTDSGVENGEAYISLDSPDKLVNVTALDITGLNTSGVTSNVNLNYDAGLRDVTVNGADVTDVSPVNTGSFLLSNPEQTLQTNNDFGTTDLTSNTAGQTQNLGAGVNGGQNATIDLGRSDVDSVTIQFFVPDPLEDGDLSGATVDNASVDLTAGTLASTNVDNSSGEIRITVDSLSGTTSFELRNFDITGIDTDADTPNGLDYQIGLDDVLVDGSEVTDQPANPFSQPFDIN